MLQASEEVSIYGQSPGSGWTSLFFKSYYTFKYSRLYIYIYHIYIYTYIYITVWKIGHWTWVKNIVSNIYIYTWLHMYILVNHSSIWNCTWFQSCNIMCSMSVSKRREQIWVMMPLDYAFWAQKGQIWRRWENATGGPDAIHIMPLGGGRWWSLP